MNNLTTVNYKSLGIQLKYDPRSNDVEGMTKIGDVYTSESSHKLHMETLKTLADERNDGVVGPIVRYRETPTREWMCAPKLGVFFAVHT